MKLRVNKKIIVHRYNNNIAKGIPITFITLKIHSINYHSEKKLLIRSMQDLLLPFPGIGSCSSQEYRKCLVATYYSLPGIILQSPENLWVPIFSFLADLILTMKNPECLKSKGPTPNYHRHHPNLHPQYHRHHQNRYHHRRILHQDL